ncbi:SDR family oxidoreductase [Methylobacterium sp. P1-11]|uniref:NAD-dependent epimerase/dehydratase family protein n=1 Tax=Methylobacterium sp. P1-11 TaxID=2024616 RepID=UPI0011EE2EED|nr:NAD-dependent epimerase/dehydratase family protein [Methylobacterium sp. P1-11]KAA0110060.1 SDR family oxidoreductase [Methylobacterium sp. P1-11]
MKADDEAKAGPPGRALLTGMTGYVGNQLATALLQSGWTIEVLGRRPPIRRDVRSHHYDETYASVSSAFESAKPDIVFHLASAVTVEHAPTQVSDIISGNIIFPTLILEAMSNHGCRNIVNTGTSWQHFDGSEVYLPTNLYAATKQAFEDLAHFYVDARGLNVLTLKLFDVYGPADPRAKLVPYLVRSALDRTEVVLSPGEQIIDLVHVRDVVTAFLMAAERLISAPRGREAFPVRSGHTLSVRELVGAVSLAVGEPMRIRWGGRPYRAREVMRPWSATSCLPGWHPSVELQAGLCEVVAEARRSG